MVVNILVDLVTKQILDPKGLIRFKAGDNILLKIQFVDHKKMVELDSGYSIKFALKSKNNFKGPSYAFEDVFTEVGSNSSAVYQTSLNLDSEGLYGDLGECDEIEAVMEIEVSDGVNRSSSLNKFVLIENTILGNNTIPPDQIPPYPTAQEIRNHIDDLNNPHQTEVETTSSIQTKRPLKKINNQSLEGSGNINISGTGQSLTYFLLDTAISQTYTTTSFKIIEVLSSSATSTITLPTSPSSGDEIFIIDADGGFSTNNCTVETSGNNFKGQPSINIILDVSFATISLFYVDSTRGWIIKEN